MTLPSITIEGRAVADPELRFTPAGKAVCNLRVAASESRKNEAGGWEDGDRIFLSVATFNRAEAIAEAVRKGDALIVTGKLTCREYDDRDGNKRQSWEVKFATVAKVPVDDAPRPTPTAQPKAADPWATADTTAPPF